jgi:hypothetical protein
MFCNSDSCDSAIWISYEPRSRPLVTKALYFLYNPLSSVHRGAWKGNFPKLGCRLLHSPARCPPYGRPETSPLLKVDHYTLHVRIKRRSDAYASLRQDTDYAGAGVVRSSWGRSVR